MTSSNQSRDQDELLHALRSPACYPHPVREVRHLETHISHVLLTGEVAYKIKKPVDLGFLDFTRLADRHRYCEEELRLNRRLAPALYLGVSAVTGPPDAPRVDGDGEPLEYAVRMREFPQSALLDRMLTVGLLSPAHMDALAARIADFHAVAARADPAGGHGTAAAVEAPMRENFETLRGLPGCEAGELLDAVRDWSLASHARLRERFAQRLAGGFVRECHGDLHLGNIAWVDGAPQAFDCIEFNAEYRWTDVASELAFLTMDLFSRDRRDLAWRFMDGYLARGGDHAGLALLRFYQVYRAVVRAKVAGIRAAQPHVPAEQGRALREDATAHLRLAFQLGREHRPALVLMHGHSGSGKSTLALRVVERLGAVRLRSDVERKRLAGDEATAGDGAIAAGTYGEARTRETYAHLARLAAGVAEAGYPALIDAANLRRWQRASFARLARERGWPFAIVTCTAPDAELRRRIGARSAAGEDPSEATAEVLAWQRDSAEPLDAAERAQALAVDTTTGDAARLPDALRERLAIC